MLYDRTVHAANRHRGYLLSCIGGQDSTAIVVIMNGLRVSIFSFMFVAGRYAYWKSHSVEYLVSHKHSEKEKKPGGKPKKGNLMTDARC